MAADPAADAKSGELTASDLVDKYLRDGKKNDYVIFDIRESAAPDDDDADDEEYAGGHIKGSIHIDHASEIKDIYEKYCKNASTVIFYGLHTASNADGLAKRYKQNDLCKNQTVYVLKGGFTGFVNNEMIWTEDSGYTIAKRRNDKEDFMQDFAMAYWQGGKEAKYLGPPEQAKVDEVQKHIDAMAQDAKENKEDEKNDK